MGAKNCPETPRQRMIGMMYLVLTAMLALNVSKNVLDAFTKIDEGLRKTIHSNETQNKGMYSDFEKQNQKDPVKVGQWLKKANEVKQKADELYKSIDKYKYEMVKKVDGEDADKEALKIESKDNIDVAKQYANANNNGKKLKAQIDEFRDFLVLMNDGNPSKQEMIKELFKTGKYTQKWSDDLFESQPLVSVVANLTKYQADIRSAEAQTVQYLRSKADLQDFNLNKLTVVVDAESGYVLQGGTYKAKIFLAAYDENKVSSYQYFVNGSSLGNNNQLQLGASGVGPHSYTVSVRIPKNDGSWETVEAEQPYKYVVGKPSATMSNVDLNVVYRGIDNRFRISVPGVPDGNIRVSANGASVSRSGDFYIVKPQQDGEITLSVSAEINGKIAPMGSEKYRVKYLPDPKSFLQYNDAGGIPRTTQDAKLSKRVLRGNTEVVANYGDDVLIKANFNVVSFTMVTVFGSVPASGSHFNSRQLSDIDQLEGGDMLIIKNIVAIGPDGRRRPLTPVTIQL